MVITMKQWFSLVIAVLLLGMALIPAAAEFKQVNNDVKGELPFFLTDCDDASAWGASAGVSVSLDQQEKTEGTGSVKFVTSIAAHSNATLSFYAHFPEEYVRGCDYISFDFYISHPDVIYSSYQSSAKIGSGGLQSGRTQEWKAALFMVDYVEGWNTVTLPLYGAQSYGADTTEIDNLQISFQSINVGEDIDELVIRIDNVSVHSYGTKAIAFIDCDSADHWSGPATIETTNHTQGNGALVFQATPISAEKGDHNIVRQCVLPTPINGANADYLEFDLYVSDASALKLSNSRYGMIFEITSSGKCDVEEYCWKPDAYVDQLKDGWNHLKLSISSARITNGAPNMRALNYFRLHLLDLQSARDNQLTVMIDNIYLSVLQDGIDDYAEPEIPDDQTDIPEPPVTPDDTDNNNGSEQQGAQGSQDLPDSQEPDVGTDDSAMRKRQTELRAKSLLIVFAFAIIGTDIVVVTVRNRSLCQATLSPQEQTEALHAAEQQASEQQNVRETEKTQVKPETENPSNHDQTVE